MSEAEPTELAVAEVDHSLPIHQRLAAILAELPAIGKEDFNEQQKFHFRSHDKVLNALNPLLAKYAVFIVPRVKKRVTSERKTRSGGTMYEVNLLVEYSFHGTAGDPPIVASAWGEGTDSGDKSTNKAMTMAFKNVLAQVFAVSTADTIDSDSESPEETTGRAERHLGNQFRELEALIESAKEMDPDPGHGGNYYYQVAINAAAKYHEKKLEDLAAGEIHDLERRFRGLIEGFEKPADTELPMEESIARTEGPTVPVPQNWTEIKAAIDAYPGELWDDFRVFVEQAGEHLFPGVTEKKRTKAQKATLLQKAASVVVNLLETHSPEEFPPPIRMELQAHWAKALDGQVLPGPEWAMAPDEVAAGRPAREGSGGEQAEETTPSAPEAPPEEAAASPAAPEGESPSPLEQTVTDAPLTDNEQQVLDAIKEQFPGATEVAAEEAK